eukprot:4049108-Alexandrium_andersonii.AAC.1
MVVVIVVHQAILHGHWLALYDCVNDDLEIWCWRVHVAACVVKPALRLTWTQGSRWAWRCDIA